MKAKSIKLTFAVLMTAAIILLMSPLITSGYSYAANNYVSWELTENDTGQITSMKATWPKVAGASTYIVNLETPSGATKVQQTTSNTYYDFSDAILTDSDAGYGTYICKVLPLLAGDVIESDELRLHRIILDMDGHGDDIVLKHIKDGTSVSKILNNNSFMKSIGGSAFGPSVYYENGSAFVGFALHDKDHYTTTGDLCDEMFRWLPVGARSGSIGGNATLYAIWFDVIDHVELSVATPKCGTETSTPKSGSEWDWDSQTNKPEIIVPSGLGYHLVDAPYAWWEMMDDEDTPFTGTFTGDNTYKYEVQLEADYGYVFPADNDGFDITGNIENGEFVEAFNDSVSYGQWMFSTIDYDAVPLWVVGTTSVEHRWDSGRVTKEATCTEPGVKTFTCEGCGGIRTEEIPKTEDHDWRGGTITKATPEADGLIQGRTCDICGDHDEDTIIARPTDFVLSADQYSYSGKACRPSVVIRDSNDSEISEDNYDVVYSDNINVGTAKATVTFKGDLYQGTKEIAYTIVKAANPMTVKAKTVTLKAKTVKKKKQTIAVKKAFTVSKQQGKVTYKVTANDKKAKKKITVSSAGKVTVKKGLKKGKYKVTVKVTAVGNANYKSKSVTVKLTVKVK